MANLKKKENVAETYEDTLTEKFPCGYLDDEGVEHTDFEYREMDGADEEAISKNTIKQNPAKVINVLLDRCIVRIGTILKSEVKASKWTEIIKSLTTADQDFAVMKIREQSVGSTITVKHVCNSCKKELTTEIDIDEFEIVPFGGDRLIKFELKKGYKDKDGEVHKEGTVRFPNGTDREILAPVANNNIALANTLMLSRIVTELGTVKNVTDAMVRSLTTGDREIILKAIQDNMFGYKFEIEVDCPNCGNSFTGHLSSINFI